MVTRPLINRELAYAPTADQAYAFQLRAEPVRAIAAGEVLVRNLVVSCDPTQFAWLHVDSSYAPRIRPGDVMRSWCAGHVVESRHPRFHAGERVWGTLAWQDYTISDGSGIFPLAHVPDGIPLSYPLGVTGINGVTAHIGMIEIGSVAAGETVVVSSAAGATGSVAAQLARNRGARVIGIGASAAGATGSVAAQLARNRGARVIGIGGGATKCRWLREQLQLTAAIDYKSEDLNRRLDACCPDGIDVYFDNVGGPTLDIVLARMADHGRIALCGATSAYAGASTILHNGMMMLAKRLTVRGFIVMEHRERFAAIAAELMVAAKSGKLTTREDIVHGLEAAPTALLRLMEGKNLGKQLVQLENAGDIEPLLCAP